MAEHYQSKHSASGRKASYPKRPTPPPEEPAAFAAPEAPIRKSRVPMMILALVLCFCIVGAGVYALVHFVIFAPSQETAVVNDLPSAPPDPTLSPVPTQAPEPTSPAADYTRAAANLLSAMSTRDKICQLMIVTPEALTGIDGVNMAGETTRQSLENYPVGGIIYNTANLESAEQTEDMISASQGFSKLPLFIAVDEEGGNVARVAEKLGTTAFEPMYTYKDQGAPIAENNARTIAGDISKLGFNLDFAPVADVWTNPDNTAIGSRAYSDDSQQAAELVAAAVKGFSQGGVLSTLKHFPGHGGTTEDTHEGLAYIDKDVDALKSAELLPFKSGIEAGADMVMVGHLVVNAVDSDLPATLSPKVVPQLLRDYLNYDGVVITDGMTMDAITDNYDYKSIVKGIFDADIDIILQPDSLDSYITAIEEALENGDITSDQLDRKVTRILTLKLKKGIIPAE